ncbi:MAG TPA: hypothetical protein PKW19_07210, partial [Dictyoglomaceae bacterium]|nr:hypothetical protein [Dictyoglomaceae bacterium]
IVGIISIHILLSYVRRAPLNIFAYYRFILALAVLLAYFYLRTLAIIVFSIAIIYLIVGMVRKNEKAIS